MALTQPPSWATDTNYDAGSDAWNGLPTKRAPSAGEGLKGKIPGEKFRAQVFNYLLNAISARISTLIDHVEDTASAFGLVATDARTTALAECIELRAASTAIANWSLIAPNFAGKTASAVHVFGSRLIVGFTDGAIYTSDDYGATWTSRTSNTTKQINAFADNSTVIVAVCDDREIVTSTDGATWTARTSNAAGATIDIDCVVWDGALFIAAGDIDPTYGYIGTSPDGVTWTKQTAHHTGTAVGYARIATDGAGKSCMISQGAGTFVSFSTNGTTWGAAVNPSGITTHRDVAYVAGVFVILGTGTNAISVTTTDGATFATGTEAPGSSGGFATGVVRVDGAIYANGGQLYRSFDGLTWHAVGFIETGGTMRVLALGRIYATTGNTDELARTLAIGAL